MLDNRGPSGQGFTRKNDLQPDEPKAPTDSAKNILSKLMKIMYKLARVFRNNTFFVKMLVVMLRTQRNEFHQNYWCQHFRDCNFCVDLL